MKRTNPSLQYLAAAASAETTTSSAMFHRPPYRGGGRRRNFSDQKSSEGGNRQFLTGDSHFYAVQDTNRRFRPPANRGSLPNSSTFRPRQPYFNSRPNQSYVAPPPLAFDRNQQFRPTQQFRLRPPKPLDYRNWEYAKSIPPPQCERFTVLSYNILADSLATSHRGKLYFHIPRHILDWEWRKKSIVFELGLWSADVLCLQEVDRFQDLEEDLKLRGYAGIWKMRTGDPVDGCAIFWHVSRFKLLYEEFIEFDKHGLRNNVAQICVLESKNSNKQNDVSALSESSSDSNKVVICNIHVLYNPKRGEIKLGQIRLLLERAHAVSKLWDDAPVVLCGDFNCTPKSPLYNFILEAKLNLSELPRDKVSGQASAEIHPTRPYIPNTRAPLASEIVQGPNFDDGNVSPSNLFLDMQQKMGVNSNSEDLPLSCSSQPPDTQRDVPTSTCVDEQRKKGNGELSHDSAAKIHRVAKDECKHETELALNVQPCSSTKSPINSYCGNKCSVDLTKDKVDEASLLESHPEDILSNETRYREDINVSSNASCDSHSNYSQSKSHSENENLHSGKNESSFVGDNSCHGAMIFSENASIINKDVSLLEPSQEASLSNASVVSSANWSSLSVGSDKISSPTLNEVESSHEVTSVYSTVDRKIENPSLHEFIEIAKDQESLGEDCATFLSELHNTDDGFPSDLNLPGGQQMHPSSDGILDTSAEVDFEPVDMGPIAYDPSTWTPVEIETASGSSECTVMEHPLKLRSTYSEVEDHSRTRESNGEPLVTSYNRCFLGTVDYIWHSEGLQTVKVLAPIPKHALQWTSGFPTKKWGSDHIALVSELAFTRDTTNPNPQVQ